MPMSFAYLGDGGILIKGEGVVTASDVKGGNDIIYESPEKIKEILYQICDFSNISDVKISGFEIRELAIQDKKAAEINPNMLIALVTGMDFTFGLSRMWEAFSCDSPFESKVFRNMDDAEQWIREKLRKVQTPAEK